MRPVYGRSRLPPRPDAPLHSIIKRMLQTYLLDGVAGASLLVFAAALRRFFRKVVDGGAALADVAFGAGVTAASVSFVQAAFGEVLANHVAAGRDAGLTRTLFDLVNT